MTFRVVILPRASMDIEANARWWATHHSVEQAVRWFNTVHEQLRSLAHTPERCAIAPEDGDFPSTIREKLVGTGSRPGYRAVFTIKDETVYVLTVRSGAQDKLRPDQVDLPV